MSTDTNNCIPKAAIAQLCSTSDKLANLVAVAKCAGMAKKAGASMLFLPECFGFLGENANQTLNNSDPPLKMDGLVDDDDNGAKYKIELDEQNKKMCIALASVVNLSYREANIGEKKDQTCTDVSESSHTPFFITNIHHEQELQSIISKLKLEFIPSISNDSLDEKAREDRKNTKQGWMIIPALQTIAKESGLWISAGGMHVQEQLESTTKTSPLMPKVYNTHVIVNSFGSIVATYRKIHLFDVSIPSQNVNLRESATTKPGKKLVVCDTPIGRLGLTTCYDLRFPEMFSELSKMKCENGNAQIIAVPSAFTVPTGKAHWHVLLRARAIENQCFIIAAAQNGKHNEKRKSYGHSLAVGPWGDVMVDAGSELKMEDFNESEDKNKVSQSFIVVCDIDLDVLNGVRERMPIQSHRENATFSF